MRQIGLGEGIIRGLLHERLGIREGREREDRGKREGYYIWFKIVE